MRKQLKISKYASYHAIESSFRQYMIYSNILSAVLRNGALKRGTSRMKATV